jgi:hypothetical protein
MLIESKLRCLFVRGGVRPRNTPRLTDKNAVFYYTVIRHGALVDSIHEKFLATASLPTFTNH